MTWINDHEWYGDKDWEELVEICFMVLSQNFFGDTQEDHHKIRRLDNSDKIKIGCILYTGSPGFKKSLITKFC